MVHISYLCACTSHISTCDSGFYPVIPLKWSLSESQWYPVTYFNRGCSDLHYLNFSNLHQFQPLPPCEILSCFNLHSSPLLAFLNSMAAPFLSLWFLFPFTSTCLNSIEPIPTSSDYFPTHLHQRCYLVLWVKCTFVLMKKKVCEINGVHFLSNKYIVAYSKF